jgi:hypothetical protein
MDTPAAMSASLVISIAFRLGVILAATWLIDFFVVQQLSDENFGTGKQVEIVVALLLAWRYCMPLAPWKPELEETN